MKHNEQHIKELTVRAEGLVASLIAYGQLSAEIRDEMVAYFVKLWSRENCSHNMYYIGGINEVEKWVKLSPVTKLPSCDMDILTHAINHNIIIAKPRSYHRGKCYSKKTDSDSDSESDGDIPRNSPRGAPLLGIGRIQHISFCAQCKTHRRG